VGKSNSNTRVRRRGRAHDKVQKINSRAKGAAGERELSNALKTAGFQARRGQQFSGSADSPDVVCETLDAYHIECKRVEAGNLYTWLEQSIRDASGAKIPLVIHRRSRKDWVVIMRLSDFLNEQLLKGI
jgi:Holliday junction resolvase